MNILLLIAIIFMFLEAFRVPNKVFAWWPAAWAFVLLSVAFPAVVLLR